MPTTHNLIAQRNARRQARRDGKPVGVVKPAVQRVPSVMVGDIFADMIRAITGKPPCQTFCKRTANKMNEWGADKCRENVDILAEEVHRNVKRMGWSDSIKTAAIKFIDIGLTAATGNTLYKSMIIKACDKADHI